MGQVDRGQWLGSHFGDGPEAPVGGGWSSGCTTHPELALFPALNTHFSCLETLIFSPVCYKQAALNNHCCLLFKYPVRIPIG